MFEEAHEKGSSEYLHSTEAPLTLKDWAMMIAGALGLVALIMWVLN